MAHGGQILAPAKFVMPSNEELEDAIQKHVTEESADIDQDANGGIPTFASELTTLLPCTLWLALKKTASQ